MTPPKTGSLAAEVVAAEVVAALQPLLDKTARKQDVQDLVTEFRRLNGTVNNLLVWQGVVNERHREEGEQADKAELAAKPESPLPLLTFVLTWILRFMLATAAIMGAVNLPKLAELLK